MCLMFAHKYGSAFRLLEDPAEGVKDADVVVTAVWNTAAPGTSESESRLRTLQASSSPAAPESRKAGLHGAPLPARSPRRGDLYRRL